MLPYDGMIRTGSKGVSHCAVFSFPCRPLARSARYWKYAGKASSAAGINKGVWGGRRACLSLFAPVRRWLCDFLCQEIEKMVEPAAMGLLYWRAYKRDESKRERE